MANICFGLGPSWIHQSNQNKNRLFQYVAIQVLSPTDKMLIVHESSTERHFKSFELSLLYITKHIFA